ncbi:hypothetical protein BU17DRAFT_78404 [Hysterangium stoloniferum]|nr:hypothetical protein BU17DRAFT_78404 [Hysterangium stoloniferum]
MERLGELSSQLSQLTVYDLKSYYNQAKNMVLNVSEMEAKVKEATNDDPWGASSTLMQEIAQGQQFNEIMPCIYSRFMEKEARQWREIYKALQLLEYIIKHGSERVVDDARSHLSTIKMLRNFHYIDDKGKDQGINVRNRSSEIAAMLVDLDKIRSERRKAKANRNKYIGTGNDAMSGGRYGGFGNDGMYGGGGSGGSSDYYNNGGGGSSSTFRDDNGRKTYDDYDAGDDEDKSASRNSTSLRSPTSPASTSRRPGGSSQPPRPEPKDKAPEPQVPIDDLLGDWGDDTATTTTTTNQNKALPVVANNEVDDFDDFQTAPVSPAVPPVYSQTAAPVAPIQATKASNLFDMLNSNTPATAAPPITSRAPTQQSQPGWQQQPLQAQPARPNYFNNSMGGASSNPISPVRSSFSSTPAARPSPTPAHAPSKSSANFDDLWSLGLGTAGKPASGAPTGTGNKSMKDLEKEKAQAGIWGASQGHQSQGSLGGFGGFSSATNGGGASSTGGGDDLLL